MKADELISSDIKAVVVFTRGPLFVFKEDGTGKTGNWKIDPERDIQKVIIYCRPEGESQADVYKADVTRVVSSHEEGRSEIQFENALPVGGTKLNWFEFAESGPNPVRYI